MKKLLVFSLDYTQSQQPGTEQKETGLTVHLGLIRPAVVHPERGKVGIGWVPDETQSFFGSTQALRMLAMTLMEQCDKAEEAMGGGRIVVPPPGSVPPPLSIKR